MAHILPRTKTFTPSTPIDIAPLVRTAGLAAPMAWSACRIIGRSLARLPGAVAGAFAMAYVDPYAARRKTEDWSDPSRF